MSSSKTRLWRKVFTATHVVFILPGIIALLLGAILPLYHIIVLAVSGECSFFTLLPEVTSDPVLQIALVNSFKYSLISSVVHVVLGVGLAALLNSRKLLGTTRKSAVVFFSLPLALSPVVVALVWRLLYHPILSPIAGVWERLPFPTAGILGTESTALLGVIFTNIWYGIPFWLMIFYVQIKTIPDDLIDAAALDGASEIRQFVYITIPLIRNTIFRVFTLDLVFSFSTFDLIWLMTQGGPVRASETLTTYIYKLSFRQFDLRYAAVVSIVLLFCSTLTAGLVWIIQVYSGIREFKSHV